MNANVVPQALHQALWLTVDAVERSAHGHTQLQLRCPGSAHSIGLYCYDLDISGVKVDGEDAEFEQRFYEQQDTNEAVNRQYVAMSAQTAAGLAEHTLYEYESIIQKEAEPELIIHLPNRLEDPEEIEILAPLAESEDASMQTHIELSVTVAFAIQQPNCGLQFHGVYACTDNQLRRTRAWFPCVDLPLAACPFDLHFTVPASHLAVSCGQLLKQAWTDNGKSRTFHYKLTIPTPPQGIALAAGPFVAMQAALPPKPIQVKAGDASASAAAAAAAGPAAGGSGNYPPPTPLQTPPYSALRTPRTPALLDAFGKGDSTITHFAPPETKGVADHTLRTLGLAFNMFETYLGCKFPYKALQTVVLPEGMAGESFQSAAGLQILSGEMMVNERTVEQGIESRLAIAYAVAQQWFGVLMRPRTPADAWLVEGLAGYLHDLFLRRFLGKNELRFRRHKLRQAIYTADDGEAPPLYSKASPALLWGSMYGTEHLDPSGLRKWKATAVMWLLSAKVSEDIFRKQLERLVGAVANHMQQGGGTGSGAGLSGEQDPRLLSSREFLRELGKGAGARKELSALSLRWINLRGLPHITAAFTYNKKRNAIELAVRQQGSEAAKKSTEQAAEQAAKEGSAVGVLKVMLKEHDHDNIQMVQLAAKPLLLHELKVNTKPGARRAKKKDGKKKKDDLAAEHEDLDDEEQTQHEQEIDDAAAADRPPVQWVQIDPQGETLASVCLLQPDWMWAAQLERSKDTAAQSAAVAGLAALRPTTYIAISALEHCLQDDQVYPRVRREAAMALATTASSDTEFAGFQILIKLFRARCHSSNTAQLQSQIAQAQAGSNVGEYLVNETLPLAIAAVRDDRGYSPPEAAEVLVEVLKHTDNRGSFYDDSSMLAAALEALGHLRLPDFRSLQPVVKQLDRFLARETVLPSYHAVVAQAGLRALVELALVMRPTGPFISRVAGMCSEHSEAEWHPELRRTSYDCLMRMAAALSGLDHAINLGLDAVAQETAPLVRLGIMEDIQPIVLQTLRHIPKHHAATPNTSPFKTQHAQHAQHDTSPLKPNLASAHGLPKAGKMQSSTSPAAIAAQDVSQETLLRVHSLFRQPHCVKMRHLAFMLLSRLGGLPPTLYRPMEEPEVAGTQEPATSLQTHTMGPAPAGPAKSGGGQGVLSGAQGLLSAEPSMRDLEEVTGKEIQSCLRQEAAASCRAPSPYPSADPHMEGQPHGHADHHMLPQEAQALAAGPSKKRPKSTSPAPASAPGVAQDQAASGGPSPVSAEELQAIMNGGGPQPKPRRKRQKTDAAAGAGSQERSVSPAPRMYQQPSGTAAVDVAHNQQHQRQQQQSTARDHTTGAGQFAAPPARDSSSAALARAPGQGVKRELPEPVSQHAAGFGQQTSAVQQEAVASESGVGHQANAFARPPARPSGPTPSGQGRFQQPTTGGTFVVAPPGQGRLEQPSASGPATQPVGQQGRAGARPAESQGGSMASEGQWGTEEERMERKRQKEEAKLRMKEMETPEEKAARRQAKRDKKARKSMRADSMADSAGGRTVDVSDITS